MTYPSKHRVHIERSGVGAPASEILLLVLPFAGHVSRSYNWRTWLRYCMPI